MSEHERFTVRALLAEARAQLTRVTPEQAFAALRAGALILDTRCDAERAREGVIPGSLHTPLSQIQWLVDPASGYQHPAIEGFDQTLIVVCNEGYSSSLAAASLKRLGFVNATDMDGGFRGWKAAGLPVCPPENNPQPSLPAARGRRRRIRPALYRLFLRVFE